MTDGDRLAAARGRRIDLRDALVRLEQAVATPAPGREGEWLHGVHDRVDELVLALGQHLEVTEAEDGLFDDIMAEAPRLAHAIDRLRDDHRRLTGQAEALRDRVQEPASAAAVERARRLTVELMVELVEHRHRGADLVYDAFNVDIEAVD